MTLYCLLLETDHGDSLHPIEDPAFWAIAHSPLRSRTFEQHSLRVALIELILLAGVKRRRESSIRKDVSKPLPRSTVFLDRNCRQVISLLKELSFLWHRSGFIDIREYEVRRQLSCENGTPVRTLPVFSSFHAPHARGSTDHIYDKLSLYSYMHAMCKMLVFLTKMKESPT